MQINDKALWTVCAITDLLAGTWPDMSGGVSSITPMPPEEECSASVRLTWGPQHQVALFVQQGGECRAELSDTTDEEWTPARLYAVLGYCVWHNISVEM